MASFAKGLRIGASALGIAVAAMSLPAWAQDTPADETIEDQQEAPGEGEQDIIVRGTGTNISGVKQVGSQSIVLDREEVLATGKTSVADVLRTLPQVQNVTGSFDAASSGGSGSAQNGTNPTRGTAINLRGVGQGATLTLVDGHRITPSGTAAAFTEANVVPLAALERVEVIADGASAVYGSDAIAGVINYVLRKNFTGVEVSGRYTAGAYGNDEWALSGVAGVNWNAGFGEGNIIATFEYGRRDPYLRGRNPRLRADQSMFGGNDNRFSTTNATTPINGNIYIPITNANPFDPTPVPNNPNLVAAGPNRYWALPLNPDGRILTIADLQEVRATGSCAGAVTPTCVSEPNLIDRSDVEDYLSQQTRKQAAIFFSQEIGGLEFYDEFFWTRTDQFNRVFTSGNQSTNPTVTINPGSPYYAPLAGLPNATRFDFSDFSVAPRPITIQYNLLARLPEGSDPFGNQNFDESFNNTVGVRTGLFSDWNAELYYNFGQNKTCGVCYLGNYIALETTNGLTGANAVNALQNLINRPLADPLALNPLSTAPFTQAQLDYVLGENSQYSQNWSHDIVGKLDGSIGTFLGGTWKFAVGGEYYAGIQKLQNNANRPPDPGSVTTPDARARTARKQHAVFGELYMPIVSPDMEIPGIRELILNGAVRYDHYSDFGETTNKKISATWEIFDGFRARGSWGTSFRAPGLPELNSGAFSVGLGGNYTLPTDVGAALGGTRQPNGSANIINIIGSNPNLKAETGRNWQLGFDYVPAFERGLRLSATYYNLTYENKLGGSGVPFTLGAFAPGALGNLAQYNIYQPYILALNNTRTSPGNCSALDPRLAEYEGFLYAANIGFNPRDFCAADILVDGRSISAANTLQEGLDMSVNYAATTDIGNFNLGVSVSHILSNMERLDADEPMLSRLDVVGRPISWRGRGNLSYQTGPFSATLFGNYIGSYTNDQPITLFGDTVPQPVHKVPSWTTFDLTLAFSFPQSQEQWRFLRGTRLQMSVTNLFDNDPPIVNSLVSGSSSIDLFTHNAFGRSMQISLTKAF